jgi:hypothetical protein
MAAGRRWTRLLRPDVSPELPWTCRTNVPLGLRRPIGCSLRALRGARRCDVAGRVMWRDWFRGLSIRPRIVVERDTEVRGSDGRTTLGTERRSRMSKRQVARAIARNRWRGCGRGCARAIRRLIAALARSVDRSQRCDGRSAVSYLLNHPYARRVSIMDVHVAARAGDDHAEGRTDTCLNPPACR